MGDDAIIAGQTIVGGESFITSGAVPAGVSFTITATSTGDGGAPNGQGGGLGVAQGQAGSGIDNNFNDSGNNPNYSEELTFTISGVTGGTVQFSSFATNFAGADEYMNLNGGGAQLVASGVQYAVSGSTFRIAAAPFSEQGFDSRFVIDELTFDAVAIPEPSTMLFGTLGLGLFVRRRRA